MTSQRFKRIAQLLFTSSISDEETSIASESIEIFNKAENDLSNWLNGVESNLEVFNNYHGKETSLVIISEAFKDTMEKQKQKYENMITTIKQAIESLNTIQDVEMQDMITNLTSSAEDFSALYNELTGMQVRIGEAGFIKEFKEHSQKILNSSQPFFDVINRVKSYMLKNILGRQALS